MGYRLNVIAKNDVKVLMEGDRFSNFCKGNEYQCIKQGDSYILMDEDKMGYKCDNNEFLKDFEINGWGDLPIDLFDKILSLQSDDDIYDLVEERSDVSMRSVENFFAIQNAPSCCRKCGNVIFFPSMPPCPSCCRAKNDYFTEKET